MGEPDVDELQGFGTEEFADSSLRTPGTYSFTVALAVASRHSVFRHSLQYAKRDVEKLRVGS